MKTPSQPAETLRRKCGWVGGSIGQMEALAGINIQSERERQALWAKFKHLYGGESQVLLSAVMNHCAKITLRRVKKGDLCLLVSPLAAARPASRTT